MENFYITFKYNFKQPKHFMSCLWGELGVQERKEGRLHCTSFCNHGNLFKKIRKEGTSFGSQWFKDSVLPQQGTQVPSLVRELDPTTTQLRVPMPQLKILQAVTKIHCSQINKNKYFKKRRESKLIGPKTR